MRDYGQLWEAIAANFEALNYELDDYLTVPVFNSLCEVHLRPGVTRDDFDRAFEYGLQEELEADGTPWLRSHHAALRVDVHPPEPSPTGTDRYRLADLLRWRWRVDIADTRDRHLPRSMPEYYER
jgi:hypothetical protein